MTFLIGIATAVVAILIQILTRTLQQMKFGAARWSIAQELAGIGTQGQSFLVYVVITSSFVLLASILVAKLCPVAAGSGIPEIKCTLNGENERKNPSVDCLVPYLT